MPTVSAQLVFPEADKTVKVGAEYGDILSESRGQQTDNKRRDSYKCKGREEGSLFYFQQDR